MHPTARRFLFLALSLASGTAALCAADSTEPIQFQFSSSSQISISLQPDQPNEVVGDIDLRCAGARLLAEVIRHRANGFGPTNLAVLVETDLTAKPGQVLTIDTSRCTLEGIPFRGALNPQSASVRRAAFDPLKPTTVRFQAVLAEVGDFHGLIHLGTGWQQHVGWARRIEVAMAATLTAEGSSHLTDPRLVLMTFIGDDPNQPDARNAAVLRTKRVIEQPQLATLAESPDEDFYLEGSRLEIEFDDAGKVKRFNSPKNNTMRGDPNGATLRPPKPAATASGAVRPAPP